MKLLSLLSTGGKKKLLIRDSHSVAQVDPRLAVILQPPSLSAVVMGMSLHLPLVKVLSL